MEVLLPDILADLSVISAVNEGYTLTSNDGKIQVIKHEGAGATRKWKGETRSTTVAMAEKKILYAIEYATLVMESIYLYSLTKLDSLQVNLFNKRLSSLQRIRVGLDAARGGIQRLGVTYKDDRSTIGKIQTLIGSIEFHVGTIKSKLSVLQKKVEGHNTKGENLEDSD